MEKNALVAIVMSMLVLILWSVFFSPKPQPVPVPTEKAAGSAETGKSAAAPAAIEKGTVAVPETPGQVTPNSRKAARDVVVETSLFRAVFTEDKAALKSFELKDYRQSVENNSPRLDMIKNEKPNLILGLYRNSVPGFSDAVYEADTLELKLGKDKETGSVRFRWTSPDGVVFIKTYDFKNFAYDFGVEVTVENRSQRLFEDNIEMILQGAPFEASHGTYALHGMVALRDGKFEEKEAGKIKDQETEEGSFTWFGYQDNYFLAAMVPWEPLKTTLLMTSPEKNVVRLALLNPPLKLDPMQKGDLKYHAYFGPKDLNILKSTGYQLDRVVNFGWFDIIAKPLLYFMKAIYRVVHNYGVAIILLTVVIKILFWPLTQKSYKSMKSMQRLQPHMQKLREKYKDNKEKLNQEMMSLYKSHKVNPFGGCLPMVIQIPVFFALYRVLGYSIEIRQQPFMLWINDLSSPDRLNVGFQLPYVGGLPVLTLLMGASMFIQQKMTPTTGDPTQAKIMLLMPVIFTFMFINFPAGLVLYWFVNNLLSIGQQYFINKSK